jgi:hypothetical protein
MGVGGGTMNFQQKYDHCVTWQEKVIVMRLYHSVMLHRHTDWSIRKFAQQTGHSSALISENLRLAEALDKFPKINECKSRQSALDWLKKHDPKRFY